METEQPKFYVGKSIRIFVSYNTTDKLLAGAIKDELEVYGIEVFLAHEDITPSYNWQDTILSTLKQCDIFFPLLTENFHKSSWTDQEAGIAFAQGKLIISLKIDIDPYGFIGRYQAYTFEFKKTGNEELGNVHYDCENACKELLEIIGEKHELKENLKDCLIKAFINSRSWSSAKKNARVLSSFDNFTDEQINAIVNGSIYNDQIYGSLGARSPLRQFIRKFDKRINQEKKEKLLDLLTPS